MPAFQQKDVPPEWIFLQWFEDYQEAASAVVGFQSEIRRNRKLKDYKVSTVVQWSSGYALYAIPPA